MLHDKHLNVFVYVCIVCTYMHSVLLVFIHVHAYSDTCSCMYMHTVTHTHVQAYCTTSVYHTIPHVYMYIVHAYCTYSTTSIVCMQLTHRSGTVHECVWVHFSRVRQYAEVPGCSGTNGVVGQMGNPAERLRLLNNFNCWRRRW